MRNAQLLCCRSCRYLTIFIPCAFSVLDDSGRFIGLRPSAIVLRSRNSFRLPLAEKPPLSLHHIGQKLQNNIRDQRSCRIPSPSGVQKRHKHWKIPDEWVLLLQTADSAVPGPSRISVSATCNTSPCSLHHAFTRCPILRQSDVRSAHKASLFCSLRDCNS